MTIVLDTSILIEIEKKNPLIISKLKLIANQYPSTPQITFINYFEFINGIKNKSISNKTILLEFINKFPMINTTKKTAHILSDLKRNYGDLPLADLMIASQTIENDLTLITKDHDFDKIKELRKEIL